MSNPEDMDLQKIVEITSTLYFVLNQSNLFYHHTNYTIIAKSLHRTIM